VILPLSQKHHDISVLNDNQTCLSQDSLWFLILVMHLLLYSMENSDSIPPVLEVE
jgi:hypothetical protein